MRMKRFYKGVLASLLALNLIQAGTPAWAQSDTNVRAPVGSFSQADADAASSFVPGATSVIHSASPVVVRIGEKPTVASTPYIMPTPPPAPVEPSAGAGSNYVKETQRLLEALKVNVPPALVNSPVSVGGSLSKDHDFVLAQGKNELVNMIIGGSTTVSLPGGYDQAVVVIPDVADVVVVSPGKAHIIAKSAGTTDIIFSESKTGRIFKAHVIVGLDVSPIQQALNRALPGEHIIATAISGSIYLTGITRNVTTASAAVSIARKFVGDNEKNVINKITVLGGQQVLLKVQVAEVRRSIIKQFGMNSSINNRTGNFAFGNNPTNAQFGINASNFAPSTGTTAAGVLSGLGALAGTTNPAGFISTKVLGSAFTSVLSALETEGFVRTLAEPTLVTISGKTANMLAGGQYPVPAVSQDGRLGTDYRNFGVSLGFTPTVNSPGLIALDLRTEVSELGESVPFPLGNSTVNIPVFNTRSANTSVELPSGGTLVIAGLMQNDIQNTISGLPGIKDIPILGKLFSSTSFQKNETELVVTVTAYLVEPIDPSKTQLPTDGLTPPSDADIYLMNRLTGMYSRRALTGAPAKQDGFGYITE